MPTKIEWTHIPGTTGESWNFIGGCTKVSEGCANCYALRDSWRIMHNPKHPARYDGVAEEVNGELRWTGRINIDRDALDKPLRWKKPRTVFVCSMSDFWHPAVPLTFQLEVWDVIRQCPQHIFLILTKRPEQMTMLEYVGPIPYYANVWYGVTVESEKYLWRVSELLKVRASLRFVSHEPMLGGIDIHKYLGLHQEAEIVKDWVDIGETNRPHFVGMSRLGFPGWQRHDGARLDWLLAGCESGPHRRHVGADGFRDLRDQCQAAGIPFFLKQMEIDGRVSKEPSEWPADLRVRQFPERRQP